MEIISTRHKEKIPKGFSYPIGAEKLSESILSYVKDDEAEVSFWVKDEYWASSFNEKIKNEEPIKIIHIQYYVPRTHHSSSNSMIESGHYEPKWKIRINSVPTKYVSSVKKMLLKALQTEAVSWLKGNNSKKQVWERYYDPKKNVLSKNI